MPAVAVTPPPSPWSVILFPVEPPPPPPPTLHRWEQVVGRILTANKLADKKHMFGIIIRFVMN